MARRDEGAYPPAVCDRGATKPDGLLPENPPGGGSFARGRRWLVPYSPLRGCAELAALATAKIPRRRPPANFKAGSEHYWATILMVWVTGTKAVLIAAASGARSCSVRAAMPSMSVLASGPRK